jgi:hypothetical protein
VERALTIACCARVTCYLSFLEHARCPVRGFHNFLSYQRAVGRRRHWRLPGQAVLALAEVLASRLPQGYRAARPRADRRRVARGGGLRVCEQAYVIQAWAHLRRANVTGLDALEKIAWLAAQRLVECYERSERPDWPWFESRLTYANAVLPHALYAAAERWPQEAFLAIADSAFAFLDRVTTVDNVFWPIGNRDWYPHGEEKALYDQQPVEAATMASAALAA